MRRHRAAQFLLWLLASALMPAAAGPGRVQLDPGAEVPLPRPPVSQAVLPEADLMVEPGGWLPLSSAQQRIEVMAGEVLVVLRSERLVIPAGERHLIAAGTALGLVNIGSDRARVRITAASSS